MFRTCILSTRNLFRSVTGTRIPIDIGRHQFRMPILFELGVEEPITIPSNDSFQ